MKTVLIFRMECVECQINFEEEERVMDMLHGIIWRQITF